MFILHLLLLLLLLTSGVKMELTLGVKMELTLGVKMETGPFPTAEFALSLKTRAPLIRSRDKSDNSRA